MNVQGQSCPPLATLWAVALQAPLSMRFSKQEYKSGFPFPIPGDPPEWGFKPASPVSPALQEEDSLALEPSRKPRLAE